MGEVYRARDPRLGREVAVKVLPASFSNDADRLRRFEQEARAAGALDHPNILAIHDIGTQDGAPYVVSELLEGETLRARLAGGAFSPRKALGHALQIAHGLAAAHEKGVVHRDLKPENIFVTRDGRVKILDFGLAKLTQPEGTSGKQSTVPTVAGDTGPGVVLGTLGYMSPEQVRGKPADPRSDIFSFGAILYEMLSGRRAFHGDTAADTMSAILMKDPPDLSVTNQNISPGLERVVRHCLEKDSEQRFHSAHDLAFDLAALSDVSGSASGAQALRPRLEWRRRTGITAGAVIAALVIIAGALVWRARAGKNVTPGGSAVDRKSIAVLPFQNLSPDPENAFFAEGMTEDILTQLAKIRDLKVISRSSVMRYKGSQKPIQTIAQELGVATVLEGSVRRAENRVRIVSQLIDARTDEHLWAETYDRELKDVFAIQAEVAQQIAGALRATLRPAEKRRIDQSPTRNLAAYDQYLKGRELYYRYRKPDNEVAIDYFQKALELDSGFALAYAGLADTYAQRALRFGFPSSWLDSSLEMSGKAIALNPDLADGYKARGLAHLARAAYRESLDAHKKAVEINPSHAVAIYNVGAVLRFLGRFDEALPWERRAVELDPKNPILASGVGVLSEVFGDAKEAERWFKHTLELQAELGQGHAYLIWFYLGQHRDPEASQQAQAAVTLLPNDPYALNAAATVNLITGNLPRARELLQRVLGAYRGTRGYRDGGAGVETNLAYVHLQMGSRAETEVLLNDSIATDRRLAEKGNQDWSVPFDTACVHALRGEKDEAFLWLDKSIDAGWRGWPVGTRSPLLDSLRADPRFKQIESRLEAMVAQMRRRAGLS
jgi:serine/threonine protein kinase/tetratricopeptide (TPR) repeat protein